MFARIHLTPDEHEVFRTHSWFRNAVERMCHYLRTTYDLRVEIVCFHYQETLRVFPPISGEEKPPRFLSEPPPSDVPPTRATRGGYQHRRDTLPSQPDHSPETVTDPPPSLAPEKVNLAKVQLKKREK